MNQAYLTSGTGLLKLSTLILGFTIFVSGFYVHFESDWRKKHVYQLCKTCNYQKITSNWDITILRGYPTFWQLVLINTASLPCPGIWMEIIFVVTTALSFLMSAISLLVAAFIDPGKLRMKSLKYLDFFYHLLAFVAEIVSGSLLIYSAARIDQFLEQNSQSGCLKQPGNTFLTGGKIVVGVLTMKLGLLYGATSLSIWKESSDGEMTQLLL